MTKRTAKTRCALIADTLERNQTASFQAGGGFAAGAILRFSSQASHMASAQSGDPVRSAARKSAVGGFSGALTL